MKPSGQLRSHAPLKATKAPTKACAKAIRLARGGRDVLLTFSTSLSRAAKGKRHFSVYAAHPKSGAAGCLTRRNALILARMPDYATTTDGLRTHRCRRKRRRGWVGADERAPTLARSSSPTREGSGTMRMHRRVACGRGGPTACGCRRCAAGPGGNARSRRAAAFPVVPGMPGRSARSLSAL